MNSSCFVIFIQRASEVVVACNSLAIAQTVLAMVHREVGNTKGKSMPGFVWLECILLSEYTVLETEFCAGSHCKSLTILEYSQAVWRMGLLVGFQRIILYYCMGWCP